MKSREIKYAKSKYEKILLNCSSRTIFLVKLKFKVHIFLLNCIWKIHFVNFVCFKIISTISQRYCLIIIRLCIRLRWRSESPSQGKLGVCIIRLRVEVDWKQKSDYYPEQSRSMYNPSRVRPIAIPTGDGYVGSQLVANLVR